MSLIEKHYFCIDRSITIYFYNKATMTIVPNPMKKIKEDWWNLQEKNCNRKNRGASLDTPLLFAYIEAMILSVEPALLRT